MKKTTNPYLFVYGSLLDGATGEPGQRERQRLRRAGRSLGAATLGGRLYHLGSYPGLVLEQSSSSLVHGQIFRLLRPDATLRWLDEYEGVRPEQPTAGEYRRAEETVTLVLGEGAELLAWVYVYQGDLSEARLIPDGRWCRHPASQRP